MEWRRLPDFTWLDLGQITANSAASGTLRVLAGLQSSAPQPSLIFISGFARTKRDHEAFASTVFSRFPHPESIEIDLEGEPDFRSALAKLVALRKARSEPRRNTAMVAAADRNGPPRIAVPNSDLRTQSGRLSAKMLASLFGVSLTELGRWIGRKKAAISKTPDAEALQGMLQPLAEISLVRQALPDEASFRKWLRTEHRLLESGSPLHWIQQGRIREIADFVNDLLTGQPT